jgi:imidazolonepropionase-like amidohydrolase
MSATSGNAALLEAEGELGVVSDGALADLIVVDGDPLADLGLLQDQGAHIPVVMRGGHIFKCDLA